MPGLADSFDWIVVGGGSAGCVFANRLSADPGCRVLLIEAGEDTPPDAVPAAILDSYPMALFHGDRWLWPGLSATVGLDARGRPRSRIYEQGRVMGGGSSVNVQAANRGLPRDYDEWAALGAAGWGWDDVLPWFRRLERDLDFPDHPLHGADGPIPIRRIRPPEWPPFAEAVRDAFAGSGLAWRDDQNADFDDGMFPPAFSNENDARVSTARAHLDATVRARRNLTISAQSRVVGLTLRERRVEAVEVERGGERLRVAALRGVVVTAGALQSPALLMRAGIGPAGDLAAAGVAPRIDRPGVGRNLRDHPALTFCQYLAPALRLPTQQRRASFVALRFSSGVEGCDASDLYATSSARAGWHGLGQRLGLHFLWCNRPRSSGRVTLAGPDPDRMPVVDLGLLSDETDLERMMVGTRRLAALLATPTLATEAEGFFPAAYSPAIRRLSRVGRGHAVAAGLLGLGLDLAGPLRSALLRRIASGGAPFASVLADDARLAAFVRDNVFGVWHAAGTCRMGAPDDAAAVVDPAGKVIGTDNLWVGDASVMPRLPTANTNIPTIMIAEKLAAGLRST